MQTTISAHPKTLVNTRIITFGLLLQYKLIPFCGGTSLKYSHVVFFNLKRVLQYRVKSIGISLNAGGKQLRGYQWERFLWCVWMQVESSSEAGFLLLSPSAGAAQEGSSQDGENRSSPAHVESRPQLIPAGKREFVITYKSFMRNQTSTLMGLYAVYVMPCLEHKAQSESLKNPIFNSTVVPAAISVLWFLRS